MGSDEDRARRQPFGQRYGQLADRARIAQQCPADRQLQRRGERPWPRGLQLQRPGVPVGLVGQRVEIAFPQIGGAAQVATRAGDRAPAS